MISVRATSARAAIRTPVEQGNDKPFSNFDRFVAQLVLGCLASQLSVVPNRAEKMTDSIKYGVMICGHGSRSQSAVKEFAAMAVKMKGYFPDWPVEYGYLEFANPVIRVGLDSLIAQGVTHILAVPGMLFAAGHAKNDIPSILNAYAAEKGVSIQYGRELAVSLNMITAAGDRVRQAIKLSLIHI